MTTEIATRQNGQIAVTNQSVGMEGLEGFTADEVMKQIPYIFLVQGNNPLKKSKGFKDGDFVTSTDKVLPSPFEFILLNSKTVYLEAEVKIDNKGMIAPASEAHIIGTHDAVNFLALKPARVESLDGYIAHYDEAGQITRLFIENKILIGLVDGAPYQISFKTHTKRKSANKIAAQLMGATKTLGIKAAYEAVIEFSANEATNNKGKEYLTFDGLVKRKATPQEIATAMSYKGVEFEYTEESLVD